MRQSPGVWLSSLRWRLHWRGNFQQTSLLDVVGSFAMTVVYAGNDGFLIGVIVLDGGMSNAMP
jgi:hypothetical protein